MKNVKTIRAFLDRFEEDQAVLIAEDRMIVLPKEFIPADAPAGSVLSITIACDFEETARADARIKDLIDRIDNA